MEIKCPTCQAIFKCDETREEFKQLINCPECGNVFIPAANIASKINGKWPFLAFRKLRTSLLLIALIALTAFNSYQFYEVKDDLEHIGVILYRTHQKISQTNGEIEAYQIIEYDLDYPSLSAGKIEDALKDGYELAGFISPNGTHASILLLVKRSK